MTLNSMTRIAKPRYLKFLVGITLLSMMWIVWAGLMTARTAHVKQKPDSEDLMQRMNSSADNAGNHFARPANFKLKPGSGYSMQLINSSEDHPANHLNFLRFDVMVKLVYAFYYSEHNFVPDIFMHAYREHLRVWNGLRENCGYKHPQWFDATVPCKNKSGFNDFVSSFHNTINSIRAYGFQSNTSQIPTNKNGVIFNGAHRLAAATILSKNVTFQYFNTPIAYDMNYLLLEKKGLQRYISDLVMLEWMKLQVKLSQVSSKVFIMSVFSDSRNNDNSVRKIVSQKCSKDNGILYEKRISVTKLGMSQLVWHMYGNQHWLPGKILEMLSLFKRSEFTVVFMFFFGKSLNEIKECKYKVRQLYNHRSFKSSAHVPELPEESFILAQMILNSNSVQFLNYGRNGLDCLGIATELAKRYSLEPVATLPGFYIGREDLMIDSDSVMHISNLPNRTDVNILFLHDVDKKVLGYTNGFDIKGHAFRAKATRPGRPWDEGYFSKTVKSKWDLFYDARNFGCCYGIKFVSLAKITKYKLIRKDPLT